MARSIPLTHRYMTSHFPGLVEALKLKEVELDWFDWAPNGNHSRRDDPPFFKRFHFSVHKTANNFVSKRNIPKYHPSSEPPKIPRKIIVSLLRDLPLHKWHPFALVGLVSNSLCPYRIKSSQENFTLHIHVLRQHVAATKEPH